jgi:hypothetical protein
MRTPPNVTQRKVIGAKKPRKTIRGKVPQRRNRFGPNSFFGPGYLKGPKF